MAISSRDPLLIAAKALIYVLMAVLALVALALLVATPAVVIMQSEVLAELGPHFPLGQYWLIPVAMAIGLAMVACILAFLDQLRRIVATVGQGDPFAPVNASRLSRMGWLAFAFTALQVPLMMLGELLERYVDDSPDGVNVVTSGDLSLEGLVLALVLFILARVFRHGAAMREDLEGTV